MSTLTVTNIKATGETASRAVSGVAAAWVNFAGAGTIAARDSFNVASLTDAGTGEYDVNYSSAMATANNATSAFSSRDVSSSQVGMFHGMRQALSVHETLVQVRLVCSMAIHLTQVKLE